MSDSSDGRITLAVLSNEIGHIRESQSEMRVDITKLSDLVAQVAKDHTERITDLERCQAVDVERWESHRAEHQRQFGVQSIISAIAAIIAAVIGVFAPQVRP